MLRHFTRGFDPPRFNLDPVAPGGGIEAVSSSDNSSLSEFM
jgi:hypothetical protein